MTIQSCQTSGHGWTTSLKDLRAYLTRLKRVSNNMYVWPDYIQPVILATVPLTMLNIHSLAIMFIRNTMNLLHKLPQKAGLFDPHPDHVPTVTVPMVWLWTWCELFLIYAPR